TFASALAERYGRHGAPLTKTVLGTLCLRLSFCVEPLGHTLYQFFWWTLKDSVTTRLNGGRDPASRCFSSVPAFESSMEAPQALPIDLILLVDA
ncbi:MAG TPA: hypothetical protein VD998_03625, partial [Verrucomicrobiae bacterium]|nr:hypothetical protein [Verrucomicrobiae bacterium]